MIRSTIGKVAGPLVAAFVAGVARVTNGHRRRPLTARELRDLDGMLPGLDLSRVLVAEGSRLPLLPGFVAITLGRTIYVRGHLARRPASLLAHELAHVRQFSERGWMGMTGAYAALWLEHGYAQHPLEIEARAVELAFLRGRRAAPGATEVRTG